MRKALFCLAVLVPFSLSAESLTEPSKWELIRPAVPKPARAPVLTFERGRFGLRVCNSIGGSVKIESGTLTAEQAMSTLMACVNPNLQKLEQSLTEAITKNRSYTVQGDQLTLEANSGDKFVFRRMDMPSPEAKTRFIYVAPQTKTCTGVGKMECLQVRDAKDQPWQLHYGPIIGFDFVPGIEYRLRIKEDKVPEGSVGKADVSTIRWFLDMIVEQKVVDPKAAKP